MTISLIEDDVFENELFFVCKEIVEDQKVIMKIGLNIRIRY